MDGSVGGFRRTLRRVLGLPWQTGRYRHEIERQKTGDSRKYVPVPTHEADLECGEVHTIDSEGYDMVHGPPHLHRTCGLDTRIYDLEKRIFNAISVAEGDQARFSVSLAEDVWHMLTVDLSIYRVLLLEILAEAVLILCIAVMLLSISVLDGSAGRSSGPSDLVGQKLLIALTSVRLNTDSIFGWNAQPKSTGWEIFVLAIGGWLHWLLLNVAGAVIVTRALAPQRQLIFSPDCILRDTELCLRIQLLRYTSSTLHNINISLQFFDRQGRCHQLSLRNNLSGYTCWTSAMTINVVHKIDEQSPLCPTNPDYAGVNMVRVAVSAVDDGGRSVNESFTYYGSDGIFPSHPGFVKLWRDAGCPFPRILEGCRFAEVNRFLGDKDDGSNLPWISVDLDAFASAVPDIAMSETESDSEYEVQ